MNAQAFRPQIIEALKTLWVALPIRAPGDYGDDATERQMAILDAYCFALSDISSEAVWQTVNSLRSGKIEDASKDFCPKAPKLAEYARAEQRRLDSVNRPRLVSTYEPSGISPFEIRATQARIRAAENGRVKIADCQNIDRWISGKRNGEWPVGAFYSAFLGEVWSPS